MRGYRGTDRYCQRFAEIALSRGLITPEQLAQALEEQQATRGKILAAIIFERGWMRGGQIEEVLSEIFKDGDLDYGS